MSYTMKTMTVVCHSLAMLQFRCPEICTLVPEPQGHTASHDIETAGYEHVAIDVMMHKSTLDTSCRLSIE
jgi:hypothetical protein